ncbi:MAG TPA: efflux RND transporter periplasmic adaptor subunit [Gemmatimonadales bacterium]|nr:efflux RND transporter periplasmic adaptor subunit [Gemmatimonadales bacterium]
MTTRFLSGSLLFGLLLVASGCKKEAPRRPAPPTVVAGVVEQRDVPLVLEATGTVEPIQAAVVAAQVDGIIERVTFREGEEVTRGQVLFQIDPRPYEAALQEAEATLAGDLGQLKSLERDRDRFEELAKREFVTAQQLDQARSSANTGISRVKADSAIVARARLDLDRATVRAPISGRAGGVLLKEGNLVRAGSSEPLVVINQISPILVRFAVPATQLGAVRNARAGLPLIATPVGDTGRPVSGSLTFVDNAVDSLTGTILLKGSFPNRERSLWPGGLVRVALTLSVEKGALVVPVSAVLTGQQGSSVYVVEDSNRVSLRKVTVARTTDTLAVLASGVKAGDRVVTMGQVRITDGATVQVISGGAGTDSAGGSP